MLFRSLEVPAEHFLFVDFCPKAEVVSELLSMGKEVTILDHHKTAQADVAALRLEDNLNMNFDMTKSGARLAWEYFFDVVPSLVEYVEDRDLWKWKLENTREVMAWLSSAAATNDPRSYLEAIVNFEVSPAFAIQTGGFLTKEMDNQIAKIDRKSVV